MKIVLTGGGSGGHFYPLVAVAEKLNVIKKTEGIADMKLYFMSPDPYNKDILLQNNLMYKKVVAGKRRLYFSPLNFLDFFKTAWGVVRALFDMFLLYPDVVFGKGGYASFPALFAARILRIPVIIHESDTVPGRVNKWAGKFARRIAIAFPEAASFFPKDRVALTGNPVRVGVQEGESVEVKEEGERVPTLLILGGSQGSKIINEAIITSLSELVKHYRIIHQTGEANLKAVEEGTSFILQENDQKDRYVAKPYLTAHDLRSYALGASIIISRAGAGSISDIAQWGKPSILIPITHSNGDHQRQNAFSYASTGAALVIEERNLTPNILLAEIERVLNNQVLLEAMATSARAFARPDAAEKIAKEIIQVATIHH